MRKGLIKTLATLSLVGLIGTTSFSLTSCGSTGPFQSQAINGSVLNAKVNVSYDVSVNLGTGNLKVSVSDASVKVKSTKNKLVVKATKEGSFKISVSLASDSSKKAELLVNASKGIEEYRLTLENATLDFKQGQTFSFGDDFEVRKTLYVDSVKTDVFSVLNAKAYESSIEVGTVLEEIGKQEVIISSQGCTSAKYEISIVDNESFEAVEFIDSLRNGNYTIYEQAQNENGEVTLAPARLVTLDYVCDINKSEFYFSDTNNNIRKAVPIGQDEETKEYIFEAKDNVFFDVAVPCESLMQSEYVFGYEHIDNLDRTLLDDVKYIKDGSTEKYSAFELPDELGRFFLKLDGYNYADLLNIEETLLVLQDSLGTISIKYNTGSSSSPTQVLYAFGDVGTTMLPEFEEFMFSDYTPNYEIDPDLKSGLDGFAGGNFTNKFTIDGENICTMIYNENYVDMDLTISTQTGHYGYLEVKEGYTQPSACYAYEYDSNGEIIISQQVPVSTNELNELIMTNDLGDQIALSPESFIGVGTPESANYMYNLGLDQGYYGHWNNMGISNIVPSKDGTKYEEVAYRYTIFGQVACRILSSELFGVDLAGNAQVVPIEIYIDMYYDIDQQTGMPVEGVKEYKVGLNCLVPEEAGSYRATQIEGTISEIGTSKVPAVEAYYESIRKN